MKIVTITHYHMELDFDEVSDAGGLHEYCKSEGYLIDDSGTCLTIEDFDSEDHIKVFYDEIKSYLK